MKIVRLATLLLPPLGLILLLRNKAIRWPTKLLYSFYVLAYSLLYLVGVVCLLAYVFRIDLIQWRNGYQPVFVVAKRLQSDDKLSQSKSGSVASGMISWPGFRGANRDGIYRGRPIGANWPASGPRVIWRHSVGAGYSSMAIAEGLVFTIEQRREKEVSTAYDAETGREVWRHGWEASFDIAFGGEGPRATPTYNNGLLYVQGAVGNLVCLEAATGKLIWERNFIADNHAGLTVYGISASPLVVNDEVIVLPGGHEGKSVAAYHKNTGAPLWQSMSDSQAYTSPMLVNLAGQDQILVVSARHIAGLSTNSGDVLWQIPWVIPNDNAIAQPVLLGPSRFMVSAGYGVGSVAFELTRSNGTFTTRQLWSNHYLKNKFSSSIFCDGFIYGLDETILTCLDAETGERKWKEGRYGYGQVLLAGNYVVVMAEDGVVALVEATPAEFREKARFQALVGKTWNHPALANARLYVRNASEMACYDLGQ